jgi:hypothetical protein
MLTMPIEIQIALSEEVQAVTSMKFSGDGYKKRFKAAIIEAISKARKRLT